MKLAYIILSGHAVPWSCGLRYSTIATPVYGLVFLSPFSYTLGAIPIKRSNLSLPQVIVPGYAFIEMHFCSIIATIMLLRAPLLQFELLVDFELLTAWFARGGFVPPSVTAQSELPVLHYISSCCFYGGLVDPAQLLHLLSQWASNSILILCWATALRTRLDWLLCCIALQPWPPSSILQTGTASEFVEAVSFGNKLNVLDHVTLELAHVDSKIQKDITDTLVWCHGRLFLNIDLQVPWDPGGAENSIGLGASRSLRRGECQDMSMVGPAYGPLAMGLGLFDQLLAGPTSIVYKKARDQRERGSNQLSTTEYISLPLLFFFLILPYLYPDPPLL